MSQKVRRQPVFNIPRPVLASIVVMGAIHAARDLLSGRADFDLLTAFAFVPARLTVVVDPAGVARRLAAVAASAGENQAEVAGLLLGSGSAQPWTALTYALLHGSWTHFGLNAVWLLAFGAPLARRFGTGRFLLLLAAGALAGALAHYAVDPLSLQPLIGASAAVSACMGAALRFLFRPPAPPAEAGTLPHQAARLSLWDTFRNRQAVAFLLVWLVSNFVTGIAAIPLGLSDMPVAWQAHVGGFLLGLVAFPLFDPVRARPATPDATAASVEDAE